MPNNYNEMIKDFFEVYDALDDELGNDWDTGLITLEVNIFNKEQSFSAEQLSEYLTINIEKIRSFFVIHCCLSNQLDKLINNQKYKSWSVSNSILTVDLISSKQVLFVESDIAQLLKNTEQCGWSFDNLKDSNSQMLTM